MKLFSNLEAISVKASSDFESVLAFNQTTGDARDLQTALEVIKSVFETVNVPYAIGGALAYGFYAKPRTTNDVDVFSRPSSIKKVLEELDKRNIKYIKEHKSQYVIPKGGSNRSDFDILLGIDDAHEELMYKPNKGSIFGVEVLIARPEGLLWNYLISITDNTDKAKKAQHTSDAINLIRSGKVKLNNLRAELEETDFELVMLLEELINDSNTSGSYASTRASMQKRKQNQ